eukprot:s470_g18.t1
MLFLSSWLPGRPGSAGQLAASADEEGSAEGLRKRPAGKEEAKAPEAAKTEAQGDGDRCPISGKQGTCPMAAIMGIQKPSDKAQANQSPTAPSGGAFMAGKSLVASVQKKNSFEDSLLYRLCPLHWDDKTIKMVFMIAAASWMSGVFIGWNLRKMLVCYEFWYTAQGQVRYDDPIELQSGRADEETLQLNVNQVDEDWMYGRLVTTSSFSMKLCEVLARSSCTAFYNIAMLNLLSEIVSTKELASRFDSYILSLFLISRCLWVYIAHRRAQRALILDWHDKGEYVTNVGFFGRLDLMFSITLVEMFLIPRIVRDIVSLLHPDKRCHPFAAFGGKLYGPRSFILGFPTKDMYITESLHGIVSQVPVLVADVIITVSLCWTLSAKIGLFYFSIPEDRERWLWCRCMTWLVLVLTVVNFVLKVILFRRYLWARRRYRAWLKVKLNDPSQPDACRRALRKEWRAYFGELSQTLVHEPLSP